jgi:NADPH-dependent ferric siderophore reductase
MSLLTSLARQVTQQATIVAAHRIAAHTYHLTLASPAFTDWKYVPGQTLNVFFGLSARGEEATLRKRTYSVWNYDPQTAHLELAICTFSDGPGARWAAQCRAGDEVSYYGPGGKFLLDPTATGFALLGDVSCLSHFYSLRRQIPAGIPVISVIHAQYADDCFPDLDGSSPLHFVVADTLFAEQYLAAAKGQGLQSAPQTLVYWGGPQTTCVAGHRLLQREWQWPDRLLKTKPFWK